MGMSPAQPIVNSGVGIFEEVNVVGNFGDCIDSLKRFIDDGIGMWEQDPDLTVDNANWARFKSTLNSCGLEWTFSPRSQSAVFVSTYIDCIVYKACGFVFVHFSSLIPCPMCSHRFNYWHDPENLPTMLQSKGHGQSDAPVHEKDSGPRSQLG